MDNKVITPPPVNLPAISVVIPMYNAEEYIVECLESLLAQTFQDFEVIVADDCSTDNSVKIVESYAPKFNGRLHITHTEKNSGGGGYVPRNLGLELAKGEYVIFVDSDDFLLTTALDTLYEAAEEYEADVVYYSAFYMLTKPNDAYLMRDGAGKKMVKDGMIDKPDLTIDDPDKILRQLLLEEQNGNFRAPWSKFLRRDFLLENKITFPIMSNGGDFIWVINVYCHAKKFLRISIPLYFYRRYNTKSVTQTQRDPNKQVLHWLTGFVTLSRCLSELANENEILRENPIYCLAALNSHFEWAFQCMQAAVGKLSNQEIYELLFNELLKEDISADLTVPFLLSVIDGNRRYQREQANIINGLKKSTAQSQKRITELENEIKRLKGKE